MKIRNTLLALAVGTLLAVACKGSGEAGWSFGSKQAPCTCGEPLGDLEGCSHRLCLSGEGNPENPDCICGPFSFASEMEDM